MKRRKFPFCEENGNLQRVENNGGNLHSFAYVPCFSRIAREGSLEAIRKAGFAALHSNGKRFFERNPQSMCRLSGKLQGFSADIQKKR